MWSVGILACLLIYGRLPFMGQSRSEIFQNILFQDVDFEALDYGRRLDVSPEARDFIVGLLDKDSDKRFTVHQAMKHPFLNSIDVTPERNFSSDRLFEKVESFKKMQKQKRGNSFTSQSGNSSQSSSFTSQALDNRKQNLSFSQEGIFNTGSTGWLQDPDLSNPEQNLQKLQAHQNDSQYHSQINLSQAGLDRQSDSQQPSSLEQQQQSLKKQSLQSQTPLNRNNVNLQGHLDLLLKLQRGNQRSVKENFQMNKKYIRFLSHLHQKDIQELLPTVLAKIKHGNTFADLQQLKQDQALTQLFNYGSRNGNSKSKNGRRRSIERHHHQLVEQCQKVQAIDYKSFPWGDYDMQNKSGNAIMDFKKHQDREMNSQIFKTPAGYECKTMDSTKRAKVDEYLQHYKELRLRNYIKMEEEKDLQLSNLKQDVVRITYEALAYEPPKLREIIQVPHYFNAQ